MSLKMSTGLMSCVRENSPPLEVHDSTTISSPSDTPDPQKRRRFHPLRNLRRIFRRRTVSHADTISPSSSVDEPDSERLQNPHHQINQTTSAHDFRDSRDLIGNCSVSSSSGGFLVIKQKRDHSADSATVKTVAGDLERDMSDYPRSLSEGRLVDSDYTRDVLSQSHDSVFSESVTASSLSIVLKAELADALKRRRNRPDASDEDLGLPRSPTTPQRKDRTINQSEGSLSILSMASTDIDEESLTNESNIGNVKQSPSYSLNKQNTSYHNSSIGSDEVDLDLSISSAGSNLSHSAAKHKMAIRPKKKGPTRHRKPNENKILPSTPEVNEDLLKVSTLDTNPSTKQKSYSLPPGITPTSLGEEPKAKDFLPSKSNYQLDAPVTGNKSLTKSEMESLEVNKKMDDGFLMRLLNRSTKKKKTPDESDGEDIIAKTSEKSKKQTTEPVALKTHSTESCTVTSPKPGEKPRSKLIVEPKPYESTVSNVALNTCLPIDLPSKPSPAKKSEKPKSGPASRQRVQPQEIPSINPSISNTRSLDLLNCEKNVEKLPPKSPKRCSSTDVGVPTNFEYSSKFISNSKNNLFAGNSDNLDKSLSFVPPQNGNNKYIKNNDTNTFGSLKNRKTLSEEFVPTILTSSQEHLSLSDQTPNIESQLEFKRKIVEKSKSFRVYTDNFPSNVHSTARNMPSLPDLSVKNVSVEKPKFLNAKPSLGRSFREISKCNELKFEINDNQLIKPKTEDFNNYHNNYQQYHQNLPNMSPVTKNYIFTSSKSPDTISTMGTKNISQIEDNIDKIMKSSFTTVLKKSSTTNILEIKAKPTNNISITPINSQSYNSDLSNAWMEQQQQQQQQHDELIASVTQTQTSPSQPPLVKSLSSDSSDTEIIPEFLTIQLNRIDSNVRPKSHIIYSKKANENESNKKRRFSNESVEIAEYKSITSGNSNGENMSPIKNYVKKLNKNILTDPAKPETIIDNSNSISRRKSITDDKNGKIDKKIDENKNERKRSLTDDVTKHESRKSSCADDTSVVLRKKCFGQYNNKNNQEDTPELMKVFARRSLKLKDSEDFQLYDSPEKSSVRDKLTHLDSDKENQSSSEEKLDKLDKITKSEFSTNQKSIGIIGSKMKEVEEKIRKEEKIEEFRSKNHNILAKQYTVPNKLTNFRNTAAFLESSTLNRNSTENNLLASSSDTGNIRKTTGSSTIESLKTEFNEESEFKGILQRRAEWEKRAQGALK